MWSYVLASPQSALRLASRHSPMRVYPRCVLWCLCMGVCYAVLGRSRCVVCLRTCLVYFIVSSSSLVFRRPLRLYTPYIWQATMRSDVHPLCQPGHNIVGAMVTLMRCTAHSQHSLQLRCSYSICYLTTRTHYTRDLFPGHNGLSQFVDDTGEPVMTVRKFNLIACLLPNQAKKLPSRPLVALRPSGTVA